MQKGAEIGILLVFEDLSLARFSSTYVSLYKDHPRVFIINALF